MELDYINLGKRIAKRREQNGMKQNVLAEKVGISNNYLSSIERGKEKPSLEVVVRICIELEVTPDYLLMVFGSGEISQLEPSGNSQS